MIKKNDESQPERNFSAVEQFALKHDFHQIPEGVAVYQELIPKTTPGPQQQYAFEVNLDRCTGCKACVTACHNENGLEEDETWRSVGLLLGGSQEQPALQHVTTACHHCLDPACMSGCPTKAYEKDPVTGIVKHLDDQCFGCQYCILKCPYDVPKYNKKKGIVHKCDMCISRLNVGEAPACVRACPNEAIKITLVNKVDVRMQPTEYVKIPDAPDSNYTIPTTKYLTSKSLPENMVSVDYYTIKPEHSHLPLVFMLVLTQLSVGAFGADFFLKQIISVDLSNQLVPFHAMFSLIIGLFALAASIFHLGRPLYAFRAILGLKTSWLSREIIVFGGFASLATLYALTYWIASLDQVIGPFTNILHKSVVGFGALGVFCSVMVYRDTRRPFWDNHFTMFKFFLTTVILGLSTVLLTSIVFVLFSKEFELIQSFEKYFSFSIVIFTVIKLLIEVRSILHIHDREMTFFKKTAILMTRQLKEIAVFRFLSGILGGVVFPCLLILFGNHLEIELVMGVGIVSFVCLLIGELLERYLFFRAVVPLKMPGGKMS